MAELVHAEGLKEKGNGMTSGSDASSMLRKGNSAFVHLRVLLALAYATMAVIEVNSSHIACTLSMLTFGAILFLFLSREADELAELRDRITTLENSVLPLSSSNAVIDQATSHTDPHPELQPAEPRNDYYRWSGPDPQMRQDHPHYSSRMRERILFCFGEQGLYFFYERSPEIEFFLRSADSEQLLLRHKRFLEDTLADTTFDSGEMDK